MAVEMPPAVAVDRPLRLGSTFAPPAASAAATAARSTCLMLKLDFEPESMQQAACGDLLMVGDGQLKLVPVLCEGEEDEHNALPPCHFEGAAEHASSAPGADTECVAVWDGAGWRLELVNTHFRAKYRQGPPRLAGYDLDVDDASCGAAAAVQQQLAAASMQDPHHHHQAGEVDPELAALLDEAMDAPSVSGTAAAAAPLQPPPGGTTSFTLQGPAPQQQQQQQHAPSHASQQHAPAAAAAAASDDADDVWDTFEAPAPQPPVPPVAAAAAAPAAIAVVLGREEDEHEDDEDGAGQHHCSDDESDGVGVEVF